MAENIELNQIQVPTASGSITNGSAAARKKRGGLAALLGNPLVIGIVIVLVAAGGYIGLRYWQDMESKIYIDSSEVSAPVISIGPDVPGVLKAVYVKEGDHVAANQQLFDVGDRVTSARVAGIITSVQNTPGQWASNQNAIVQMYDPAALRVVGHLQEDQGLSDIKIGQ